MELNRQTGIFDAERFGSIPVHVIGVGGIGSWLTLRLSDMGVRNIHVWDGDFVECHNIQNQLYGLNHVGMKKVHALAQIISEKNGSNIMTHAEFVGASAKLDGIVFVCVDSMRVRKEVWDGCIVRQPAVDLMIDCRMDASYTTVYLVEPNKETHCAVWKHYWFPDDAAQNETMACGSPLAVAPTASRVADDAMWQLIRWTARRNGKEVPLYNLIAIDLWGHRKPIMDAWD